MLAAGLTIDFYCKKLPVTVTTTASYQYCTMQVTPSYERFKPELKGLNKNNEKNKDNKPIFIF